MILETECHSLESPLQGNLHGGFGGGRGETQLGCAPCAYLTGAHGVGPADLRTCVKEVGSSSFLVMKSESSGCARHRERDQGAAGSSGSPHESLSSRS
jgi:hypothetical protein